MYCLNCDTQDDQLDLKRPICNKCGWDNSYVLGLLEKEGDDDDEDQLDVFRNVSEIRKRAVVLYSVAVAGNEAPRSDVIDWLAWAGLLESVSPQEAAYLSSSNPSQQQVIDASWRIEGVEVLLWVLRELDELTENGIQCHTDRVHNVFGFFMNDPGRFLRRRRIRDPSEVYAMLDKIHDQHWSIRNAQLNKQPPPTDLDSGIVLEKHYALNWVVGYNNAEWDDVSTDT